MSKEFRRGSDPMNIWYWFIGGGAIFVIILWWLGLLQYLD